MPKQKHRFFKQQITPYPLQMPATVLGIYEIAEQEFQSVKPEVKPIIKSILTEGHVTPDQLASIATAASIPHNRLSSLYVLYTGQDLQNLEQSTSVFNLVQEYLKAIFKDTSPTTHFQADIESQCNEILNVPIELTEYDIATKKSLIEQVDDTQQIKRVKNDPSDLTIRYIATFHNDICHEKSLTSAIFQASNDSRMLLTDQQWFNIYPLVRKSNLNPNELRLIVGAIIFQNNMGESWTIMPHEIDPGKIYYYYKLWESQNILDTIIDAARIAMPSSTYFQI